MKHLGLCRVVGIVALVALGSRTDAGTIWYNGDANGIDGLSNEVLTLVPSALTFDDFTVSSPVWIWSIFSNDLMNYTGATQARWEIRTGVSTGNGGTLVASGTSAATQTPTGASYFGLNEYTVEVSGLNVLLSPGTTYWLAVAPMGTGGVSQRSYVATTSGLNAIGTPPGNDDNSFFNSAFFGSNFQPASNVVGVGNADFSMGVAVPEPGSLVVLGLGLVALAATRRRRAIR